MRLVELIKKLLLGVAYAIPAVFFRILDIRLITITHPDRIGHLCVEPDCFLKEQALGLRKKQRALFLIPRRRAANQELLKSWHEHLPIVTSDFWCAVLSPLTRFPGLSYPTSEYAVAIDGTAKSAHVYACWQGRGPILKRSAINTRKGKSVLSQLGIPPTAWFVCVHSREGGYSPGDEHIHSFRNSSIENYRLAMEAIVQAGGWCVRVGEPNSQPCPAMECVVDYAHSPFKSDWMDVFLCANCRFFLGNSSGLYMLSSVFGVPSALANLIPGSGALPIVPDAIGIPKLLRWKSSGRPLTFPETMNGPIANFRFAWQYEQHGVHVEENAPDEIRDLGMEMLECCEGRVLRTEDDEGLQRRFRQLFRQGHYSYGAASRVGREFLRKYRHLVSD